MAKLTSKDTDAKEAGLAAILNNIPPLAVAFGMSRWAVWRMIRKGLASRAPGRRRD